MCYVAIVGLWWCLHWYMYICVCVCVLTLGIIWLALPTVGFYVLDLWLDNYYDIWYDYMLNGEHVWINIEIILNG